MSFIRFYRSRWVYADLPSANFTTAFHIVVGPFHFRIENPRARKINRIPLRMIFSQGGNK